jgi:hypothetical protein
LWCIVISSKVTEPKWSLCANERVSALVRFIFIIVTQRGVTAMDDYT